MPLDQTLSNGPSDDLLLSYISQYRTQKRRCDEENGTLRALLKRAKGEGVSTKAVISGIARSAQDHIALKAELKAELRVLRLVGVSIEANEVLESDVALSQNARSSQALWHAEETGYRAGREGIDIAECPYESGSLEHAAWCDFWHDGQEAIARELGPTTIQASATRSRPARNGKDPAASKPAKAAKPNRIRAQLAAENRPN